jgi:hypothetical protein
LLSFVDYSDEGAKLKQEEARLGQLAMAGSFVEAAAAIYVTSAMASGAGQSRRRYLAERALQG